MRRNVKFDVNFLDNGLYGFEGSKSPVDKVAELVLSSTHSKISRVTIRYEDGQTIHYDVAKVNDHIELPPYPVGEADPELERLLAEEEEIERRTRKVD